MSSERTAGRGPMPLYILVNDGAGSQEAATRCETIRSVLEEAGRPHYIEVVRRPRELAQVAERAVAWAHAQRGAVVAAGGDGTVNTVAGKVLATGLPFGVLPQGTFNYFGRAHGIPTETADAVRMLLTARVREVQVGLVNDRIFLVNGSMGLYPEVLSDREAFKKRLGRSQFVAMLAGVWTLLQQHRQWVITLEVHGETRTVVTPTLFVGNNLLQLEQMGIPDAPALEEGRLVAIMLKPRGRWDLLALMLRGAMGQLGEAEQVTSLAFTRLSVTPRLPHKPRRLKVAMDGEVTWMRTPLVFQPAPARLKLLVPG